MSEQSLLFRNGKIYTPDGNLYQERLTIVYNGKIVTETSGIIEGGIVAWQGERIVYVGPDEGFFETEQINNQSHLLIDAEGGWVLPGFIDVHVHGGYGHDFMEATVEAFDELTRFHAAHGTTAILATTVTAPRDALSDVIQTVHGYRSRDLRYAELLGVHLEGPFISSKWSGAQNPEHILPPQSDWLEEWVREYPGIIKIVTLAPESEGAMSLITWLSQQGIVPACGHTDATYDCILEAVHNGLRHGVHTFNAMKELHHREPGTVGAILSDDRISTEIIADGYHVHPACIRIMTKLKRADQVILITDAIPAAGLSDGEYTIAGLDVIVKDSVSRLKEGGNLAGSMLTMIEAFRFMIHVVKLEIEQVSRFASGNPALLLGIESDMGSLQAGKLANILLLSPDLELLQVWGRGRSIFEQ
ncbi:N-acetylglucosamine-6-phosphate deacetylase [Paenibacillus baekrokdamisoli]|uniref:N-acetylglucosamine-6-phosphate deacetylase n=1 Tax=Paenibacillus baekrokdamisoli TaxID=1712516 RepID=A0A3G9J811_9BACL|nr:N-acetylglucosamine-6-phosphate deacetylase [Paenibacillus baekrokdamisoli]MBB3067655.1 N-acetylglucosamine-6-phosphate deacetylase [Paenibacillus baekrokdamisoli]BBH19159.1 N-acetylglucosamine-6-phosphate deacetylase [Paenibacillus baekrokdamisoli]